MAHRGGLCGNRRAKASAAPPQRARMVHQRLASGSDRRGGGPRTALRAGVAEEPQQEAAHCRDSVAGCSSCRGELSGCCQSWVRRRQATPFMLGVGSSPVAVIVGFLKHSTVCCSMHMASYGHI